MNWTVGTRLAASFAGVLLLATVMGATAVRNMQTLADATQDLYTHPFSVTRAILKVDAEIKEIQAIVQQQFLAEATIDKTKTAAAIDPLDADILEKLNLVSERFLGDRSAVDSLLSLLNEWKSLRDEVLDSLARDRREEAIRHFRNTDSHVLEINRLVRHIGNSANDRAESFQNEAATSARRNILVSAALLIIAIAVGAILAFLMTRAVTRQLSEGISRLSTSSAEILATTTQVAAGATQTASAVTETTATVEEVKQTAQLASQKAHHVSDSAQRVSEISQSGRNAVEQAIAGMHRIQEQMESIADSIVRLSEQGQTIGEIITTVNDLAEQSNVLSVNAAIEASRAGEHGKGFAVVAQEVKSLAEQSKQATAQVRTILGDIQKATSAAVLAAEQGHKAVEAGVKQSAEAGDSIRQLAESIGEAARAATQIAASSQQQMAGMDQIATAMENIRQASTQNVAGTRQAETAARNLNDLGRTLGALIGRSAT